MVPASKAFRRNSHNTCNLNVHNRVHNSPSLFPKPKQIYSAHTLKPYVNFKRFILILYSYVRLGHGKRLMSYVSSFVFRHISGLHLDVAEQCQCTLQIFASNLRPSDYFFLRSTKKALYGGHVGLFSLFSSVCLSVRLFFCIYVYDPVAATVTVFRKFTQVPF
jgi:hypothetical protein